MGYNLETPWGLDELKKQNLPQMAPIVGSSTSFGAHNKTRVDCLVDLKLGRFSDPKGFASKFEVPGGYPMDSPSRGSSRKARARSNGTQIASCSVDGCGSDLSTCRDYHRRHKVCEVHSKTAIVTIGGFQKRFCQQCSRFHSLVEFDEGKRSCRKRLDGHNRRRRKSQPESMTMNSERFLSNRQVARYLPIRDPQATTGSVLSSVWSSIVKAENDPIPYNNNQSLISFSDQKNPFPGGLPQFPFLLGTSSTLLRDSTTQPVLHPDPALGNGGSNQKMFFDRALSLLSSPRAKTREVEFCQSVQPNPSLPNPIPGTVHYNTLRPQQSGIVPDGANLHSQSQAMFHIGLDRSPANLPHQTLSFSWQ